MQDFTIIPTILTASPDEYKDLIQSYNTFTRRVQVDITDGNFVGTPTIPLNQVWWPRGWQADLHLMVSSPSAVLPLVLQLKPNLVIFHAETGEDLPEIFTQLKAAGIRAGVALLKGTFPGNHQDAIAAADHVLIFAGELGGHGAADLLQIEKVPLIKKINAQAEIGWDGGVNIENVRAIARAGVNAINVGATILNATDRAAAYNELKTEAEQRGVRI